MTGLSRIPLGEFLLDLILNRKGALWEFTVFNRTYQYLI